MMDLPRDTRGCGEGDTPRCPWCGEDTSDATVTLEQLAMAHDGGDLEYAPREHWGLAGASALVATTTCCSKPVAVALQKRGVRLLAVRTDTDIRFLAGRL